MAIRKTERQHKINTDIRSEEVRLVGNGEPQILRTFDALKLAQTEEKDLIMINDGETPVVRIEEYTKFIYNLEKKQKEQKKNSIKTVIKEIKLSWNIEDNDLNTKAKKATEFLTEGDKVKCIIQLKGRQNAMPERAELIMLKFATILENIGALEAFPELLGNKYSMTIKPKEKKNKN